MAKLHCISILTTLIISLLCIVNGREHLNGLCPYRCHCRRTTVNCTGSMTLNYGSSRAINIPTNTKYLILDNTRISQISPHLFRGLDRLEKLSLKYNNITVVHAQDFNGLDTLETLDLEANHIHTIDPDAFKAAPNLRVLSLADNPLTQKTVNESMQHLGNLRSLFLHNTYVGSRDPLPEGFAHLQNLERLELDSNPGLVNLTAAFFSNVNTTNLQYLGLAFCPLEQVDNDTLLGFDTLIELDLSYSGISTPNMKNLFTSLRNSSLVTLNLAYILVDDDSGNHLTSGLFEPLDGVHIKKLRLDGNYGAFPRGLHNGFFRHLSHLQELNLDNCQLHSIKPDAFKGLHKLNKLSLKHNFISCLTDCGYLSYGSILKSLEYLDLSHNVISDAQNLVRFTQDVLPNLHFLLLQNNRISSIRKGMFEGMAKLKGLDLTENPIYYLEPGSFQSMHALQTLYLQGSIHLEELHNGTFRGMRNLIHLRLNNNKIHKVHAKAFHGLRRLETLELNGNRIGASVYDRDGWSVEFETSNLKVLDLGNNRINSIPSRVITTQPKLQQLILHYNRISSLDQDTFSFSKQLQGLDLSYNDLMELDHNHLKQLARLKTLGLAGNPFLCTCNMKDFIDWLKLAKLQLDSTDNHRCLGPVELRGKRLFDYRPGSWECKVKVIVVPFLCTVFVLLSLISCACFYFKHSKLKQSIQASDKNKQVTRKMRSECACVKELFPMNGDITPSSEEVNMEAPLIQESVTYSSDLSELISLAKHFFYENSSDPIVMISSWAR